MMDTKLENDYPSPKNDESDAENEDAADSAEEEVDAKPPPAGNVADILKRLQSSGALIKKPKQEYRCVTCDQDFRDWEDLEQHLIQHVSQPSVVLNKLPSDDEDNIPSEDENWSDEDDDSQTKLPQTYKAPQKVDISQIKQTLNKTGITLKKPNVPSSNNADAALNKLSGLGFTIKKNSSPIKQEKPDPPSSNVDLMKKLGQLGGIKLKLKSDGNNTNSFKVVNGLKDFNASDDEDDGSGNEEPNEDDADALPGKQEDSDEEQQSSQKNSESDEADEPPVGKETPQKSKIMLSNIIPKIESQSHKIPEKVPVQAKVPSRPAVKQTPKRAINTINISRAQQDTPPPDIKETSKSNSSVSTPERRESRDSNVSTASTVVVKQEIDKVDSASSEMPLFSGQIKSERSSPPIEEISTPIIAAVKSEPNVGPVSTQPIPNNVSATTPLLPVTKKEDTGTTIIEINGDSNDEDDDCCVVSSTPAPDIKPVIPKTEIISTASSHALPPSYSTSQSPYSSSNILTSRLSMPSYTEKQHAFNWNAPDSKPPIDMLEKSADDIFESLLSSAKKENNLSLSEASEYISLDTLGPQHSCDICNTRFTDINLLEDHIRMTGHSHSLVAAPSSSTLVPYSSSNILSSLLPVKQLAEQVGKLVPSGMGNSGSAFTHQQNVMINIQAYPGAGMPQSYNSYAPNQNMHQSYQQPQTNMYGQSMSGQYGQSMPGQGFSGGNQGFGQQFSSPMNKSAYSPSYSTHSPLQGMQQAVYGQSPMNQMGSQGQMNMGGQMGSTGIMNMAGQMGPPQSQANLYNPSSSPVGSMKLQNNSPIKIQNIQTFPPGQGTNTSQSMEMPPPPQPGVPGHLGQNSSPGTIRMAPGAMSRPRQPGPRGPRPTIRPGIQVQGQVRGAKPNLRMPLKRPAAAGTGPIQKRRPDMLLPGKHDNEDCQVMAMQKQRQGMPMIHSVQGAKDKLNLGSQISITKKTVNREANAMADVLASRGISIKQKQRSRSPTPERPIPHIPNLPAGMSIKHTSKSSNFSIPESKVGSGNMLTCRICKKMFSNSPSLQVHMTNAHPQSKIPMFKCDECPASYPKSLQLQHHKRTFHNLTGPNRELGIPIVDMSNEDNLQKLCNIGIYSFIPLAQANGVFGVPIISVHSMQNGNTKALQGLGADGLLSLGPLKPLPNT